MNKVVKIARNNLFFAAMTIIYIVLALVSPKMAVTSAKNSVYYIKEMLMIMPVIFVLTALLDTFVPKEAIIKYLGKEAKAKGVLLSFLLGSISAGPIYAAFPFCIMLNKKGATIKNIVIILSSWAVIKLPMLLNEAKFLGFKFMITRWVLTIIAIVIFSTIADFFLKPSDLPNHTEKFTSGVKINKDACMGCSLCSRKYPELFEMNGKKALVLEVNHFEEDKLNKVIADCPVKAITFGYKN